MTINDGAERLPAAVTSLFPYLVDGLLAYAYVVTTLFPYVRRQLFPVGKDWANMRRLSSFGLIKLIGSWKQT